MKNALTEKHSRINDAKFRFKSFLLIVQRSLRNIGSRYQKFHINHTTSNDPVISFSESDLWNPNDNDQNWILTAGKIQNLRLAIKRVNGIDITAGEVFSFWKHIGNPNFGKGYVIGREIREGCIVPTKAGGLCQLSNALYDAALKAGFEIVERHKHSQVIAGSLAEQNRDATVKWNYIDLRFKSSIPFRIEINMDSEKLLVQLKGQKEKNNHSPETQPVFPSNKLNDCFSCGNVTCFKHPTGLSGKQKKSITTFVLDEKWEEYNEYIQSIVSEKDFFILPLSGNGMIKSSRYLWKIPVNNKMKSLPIETIRRALASRFSSKTNSNIFSAQLKNDRKFAYAVAKKIPVECNHLVVSQNLLPFLWEAGALAGRTYDVLMTRLPFEKLHQRLDMAYKNNGESKTLNDFRANQYLLDTENNALTKSNKIISPHVEIIDIFKNKSILVNWNIPLKKETFKTGGHKILFPSTTIGRKGAYEVRKLAKELDLTIVIKGGVKESDRFWDGVKTEMYSGMGLEEIGLVIYPTYIENQPRFILKALAAGIPVITTEACGIAAAEHLTIVPTGNYEAFKQACELKLKKMNPA